MVICKDCVSWEQKKEYAAAGGFGFCSQLGRFFGSDRAHAPIVIAFGTSEERPTVMVPQSFGCILGKEKPGAQSCNNCALRFGECENTSTEEFWCLDWK